MGQFEKTEAEELLCSCGKPLGRTGGIVSVSFCMSPEPMRKVFCCFDCGSRVALALAEAFAVVPCDAVLAAVQAVQERKN